jgi:2-methylcitrate dehydratase PrpD
LLMEKHGIRPCDVESIVVSLPDDGARTVNNRKMPDINVQHIMAITLLDGELTFKSSHSYERMNDPAVLELKKRITLQTDPELSASKIWFQGIVEVTTRDGAKLKEHVKYVSGNPNKPMTTQEIEKKCKELMTPVLGEDRTNTLVNKILTLERVTNMRQLRMLLSQA